MGGAAIKHETFDEFAQKGLFLENVGDFKGDPDAVFQADGFELGSAGHGAVSTGSARRGVGLCFPFVETGDQVGAFRHVAQPAGVGVHLGSNWSFDGLGAFVQPALACRHFWPFRSFDGFGTFAVLRHVVDRFRPILLVFL